MRGTNPTAATLRKINFFLSIESFTYRVSYWIGFPLTRKKRIRGFFFISVNSDFLHKIYSHLLKRSLKLSENLTSWSDFQFLSQFDLKDENQNKIFLLRVRNEPKTVPGCQKFPNYHFHKVWFTCVKNTKQRPIIFCLIAQSPGRLWIIFAVSQSNVKQLQTFFSLKRLETKMQKQLSVNSLNVNVAIIQKPVNWFAKQINWLVSIWWQL